jgi:putative aldouronate transport system permease protein
MHFNCREMPVSEALLQKGGFSMGKTSGSSTAGAVSGSKLHNAMVYFKQHWQLYLIFIMPAFLLTIIFRYIPMGGILIAFTEYNPIRGILGSEWVGFDHFARFLSSPDFMRYLMNTLKLSVFGLLWGFPIPILLAFLLNRILSSKTKQKIQLVLYMPNFISVIVLCGIVRILLSPTGLINSLFGTQANFMTMPSAFRTIYIASGIWQGAGWASIIYTAALSNASKELKEAAVIDGANIIQQIKAVEWPAIKDTVLIQFIMSVGNIMSIGFEKAYALQTDMNLETSEIISTYVYKKGLLDGDYGFSTAVGLFNTVINVILLISMNKIVQNMNEGVGI